MNRPIVNPGITLGEYEAQRAGWRKAAGSFSWHEKTMGRLILLAWASGLWRIETTTRWDAIAKGREATLAEAKAVAERVAAALLGEPTT